MHEIHPKLLWIGHALDVREPRGLFDVGVTAVVDVAYEEPPAPVPRQLIYCRFPLNDGGGNDPKLLLQALRTTTDLLRENTRTLVACSAGMSRSPTIATFALAFHLAESPDEVVSRIASVRSLDLKPQLWKACLAAYQALLSGRDTGDHSAG
ncbi:MAG: hypothetical protein Aurels2KO_41840 [Aureliella sp.]